MRITNKIILFLSLLAGCASSGIEPLYSQRTVDTGISDGKVIRWEENVLKVVTIKNRSVDKIRVTLRCGEDKLQLDVPGEKERSVLTDSTREEEFSVACKILEWRRILD